MDDTADRFDRANQLFSDALELPADARNGFVRQACGGDAALCDSVLRLLSRFDRIGDFLERPASGNAEARFELQPGDVLDNRIRILEFHGRGGMGEVYRAEDLKLGEPLAIKIVRAEWQSDPGMLARFHDEVKLARRVSHPNVCRVHGILTGSVRGRELVCLEMEYLDGDPLSVLLARRGKLDASSVLGLAEGIAAGLDAAHREGIIHRDLKPSNIILARDRRGGERPVVTDFGLARSDEASEGAHTQSGVIAGSPDYMAPEQFLGEKLTAAVDIFAFGLIVYEMAAGKRPFPSESIVRAAVRRLTETPLPLSQVSADAPRHWDRVLARALARDPARRYGSAAELAGALRDRPSLASAALSGIRPPRLSRRAWLFLSGAAGCVAMSSFFVFSRLHHWALPEAPLIMLTPFVSASPANARALDLQIEKGLQQSAHVRVLDAGRIREIWKRMRGDAPFPARLEPGEAREIAMRAGAQFVLFGNLEKVADGWVLPLELQLLGDAPTYPRDKFPQSFTADSDQRLLTAAARAVAWVRGTAGESADAVNAHSRAPEEVTTSSYAALKEYSDAIEAWKMRPVDREWPPDQRAATEGHLLRAIEIDPRFAQAWAKLADFQMASYEFDKGLLSYQRAAQLIDERNLTDRESLMIRGMFALDTGQNGKAEQVFSRLAQRYPKDGLPLFHQARAVECQGHPEACLHLLDMAARKDPDNYSFVIDRGFQHVVLGQLPEAERDFNQAAKMNPADSTDQARGALAFARMDMPGVWAALERMKTTGSVAYRSKAYGMEACLRAEQGRLAEAKALLEEGLRFDVANSMPLQVQTGKKHLLAGVLLEQGQPAKTVEICRGILHEKPGIWPALDTGSLLAQAGDVRGAESCLPAGLPKQPPEQAPASLPRGVAPELFAWPIYWRRILRLWAELALAAGRSRTALALLQAAPPSENSKEWPGTLVRASIASGERETAEQILTGLFRNPAGYWISADGSYPPGFMRQAISQAAVLGMPAEIWAPMKRFLSQSN
jgi:serine/threonine protein kinase/tetratricopeptide (TPR) repeat protein